MRQNDCREIKSQEIDSKAADGNGGEVLLFGDWPALSQMWPGKVYMRVSHGMEMGSIWGKAHLGFEYNRLQKRIKGAQFTRIGSMWTPNFWRRKGREESKSTIQIEIYPLEIRGWEAPMMGLFQVPYKTIHERVSSKYFSIPGPQI